MTDADFMSRALFHAARGQGRTTPNPMVGALVVTPEGVVVGHGWHKRAGEPHAEAHALEAAGDGARGATLYVTLEPCAHAGRTGPCTRRIIDAGIGRVVAAMQDPDARVNGRGFEELRAAGIAVSTGVCADEARRLNAGFVSVKTMQRPLVILKAATSLDARIAVRGARTKLSSSEADRKTHILRAAVDAVAVGSGTMLQDDPLLTARQCQRVRPLLRVIFDRRLRTSPRACVFTTLADGPVLILTSRAGYDGGRDRVEALVAAGATVMVADDLLSAMRALVDRDVTTLLVEGGAELHAAFWRAGLVDRLHLIVAPVMLAGDGVQLFAGLPIPRAAFDLVAVEPRGADIWMEADVHRNH